MPGVAKEAAGALAVVAFLRDAGSFVRAGLGFFAGSSFGVDGREDVEGRGRGGRGRGVEAGGFEDRFQFAGADDGVDFGNVFLDFVAVALDEAAGDDELAGAALSFVAGHLEDGVDGFLLGGVDEGTGVDDEDFGVFGAGGEARAGAVEEAHHDLGIDEVFGAAERDEADGRGRGFGHRFYSIVDGGTVDIGPWDGEPVELDREAQLSLR